MALPDVSADTATANYEGDLSGLDEDFVQGRLNEVVDKIAVRWGSLVQARLDSGQLPVRLYRSVVWRAAGRLFRNTDGFRQEGDGGYQYELNPAVASGTLWFTDDDIADLTGVTPDTGFIGTAAVGRQHHGFVS